MGAPARANGRFPSASQLVFGPADPAFAVLRVTFGLLLTRDAGLTWDWICEGAVGYGGTQDPAIAVTAANAILLGAKSGLATSADGCEWPFAGGELQHQDVIDVSFRRRSPLALALTSSLSSENGMPRYSSRVFAGDQRAEMWAPLPGVLDTTVRVETIDGAESDGQRLYVSGVRGAREAAQGVLLVSSDGGKTWEGRPVPLEVPLEQSVFIAAVDPGNADRVYLRTTTGLRGRLLVTEDAGKTFRDVFRSKGPLLGFALSPDGGTVFVGGPGDGVQAASVGDFGFAARSSRGVQCLTTVGSALWACMDDFSDVAVRVSQDGGRTFSGAFCFGAIRGPLGCAPASNTATCVPEWPDLQRWVVSCDGDGGTPVSSDGGADDSGSSEDAAMPRPGHKSGCALMPGRRPELAPWLLLLGAAVARLFRRGSR